jgi:fumarate reductase subunit C
MFRRDYSSDPAEVIDRQTVRGGAAAAEEKWRAEARRQLRYELLSGASGLLLAVFMWGHMFFVASILLGTRGFDWIAEGMELVYVAQPTVVIISALFLIHAVFASRKIPAQLKERRRHFRLARELKAAPEFWRTGGDTPALKPHLESWLWIWQVRTGMIILVLGSFHLALMTLDILTGLFGDRVGIEAASSMARTSAGLVWMYAVLLLCVEFHAGIGLYRLAVKWGAGARLSRHTLWRFEKILFWFFIGLGALVLLVLAGWLPPPLAWLLGD